MRELDFIGDSGSKTIKETGGIRPWRPNVRGFAILALALLCAACASPPPISSNPLQDIRAAAAPLAPSSGPSLTGTITQGLQDASFNLDNAVTVGALDAQDAAPACLHSALKQLGIDPTSPTPDAASFTPKVSDLISAASVAYIRARQAEKLAGTGVTVDVSCKALIGQIVLDGGKAAGQVAQFVPGVSALKQLLPVSLP